MISDIYGRWYHFVKTNAKVTWYEADLECRRRYGTNLASIYTSRYMHGIHQWLKARTIEHPYIYIGRYGLANIGLRVSSCTKEPASGMKP